MFKGRFQHTLDDKGRLILPAKFSDKLTDGAIITIGFEGCLAIYSKDEWNQMQDSLSKLPLTNQMVRQHLRVLNGAACDLELDKQRRIKLPSYLIEDAGIAKECMIVGMNSIIEVWPLEKWQAIYNEGRKNYEQIAEQISAFGHNRD